MPCTSFLFIAPLGKTKLFKIQDSHARPVPSNELTRTHSLLSSNNDKHPVISATGPKALGEAPDLQIPMFRHFNSLHSLPPTHVHIHRWMQTTLLLKLPSLFTEKHVIHKKMRVLAPLLPAGSSPLPAPPWGDGASSLLLTGSEIVGSHPVPAAGP